MTDPVQLKVEGLTVHGGENVFVSDLSLTATGGQVIGITGPSGSGKTSVLHAIAGLSAPAAGRVLLNDKPAVVWRDGDLGLVLQNLHLMPVLSAHETVALPLQAQGVAKQEVAERADQALSTVGLAPHSGQLIQQLSGGQRQRVAVARVLASQPDLIFADEPASALDPHWRGVIVNQLLDEAARGAILVVGSSDPELIGRCDLVITLG